MIKFECDKGKTMLELECNISEVMADTATYVKTVYEDLEKNSKPYAEAFKQWIKEGLYDTVFDFGIHLDTLVKKLDELIKEMKESEEKDK